MPTQRYKSQVIRRRVHESRTIAIPEAAPPAPPPHVRMHAKRFSLALALIMAAGGVLLATPWASESGEATPLLDAVFTAVSASAVTGLVTVDTQSHWNFLGELVILVLIQTGGLGFMVGAGILLQMLRRGQARLSDMLLMHDGAPTLSISEAKELTWRIVKFTFLVEAAGALLLTVSFSRNLPFWEALWHGTFHSVSAFCNAGFDLQGGFNSMVAYRANFGVNAVLVLLIQAGGLSYIVFEDVFKQRRWRPLALDTKLVLLVNAIMLVSATVAILISEWSSMMADERWLGKLEMATFQATAARTAGFASISFADAHQSTLFIWVAVMMVGGAAGSTAGGIKLATVGVVFVAVLSTLRGDNEARAFGRTIPIAVVLRAMATIFVFVVVHFAITLGLVISEDYFGDAEFSLIAVMFEAMSAVATVGLSTGITPDLTEAGKILLCIGMFFGRLGPLTVAYALQRRQRPARYRFPTGTVRIG